MYTSVYTAFTRIASLWAHISDELAPEKAASFFLSFISFRCDKDEVQPYSDLFDKTLTELQGQDEMQVSLLQDEQERLAGVVHSLSKELTPVQRTQLYMLLVDFLWESRIQTSLFNLYTRLFANSISIAQADATNINLFISRENFSEINTESLLQVETNCTDTSGNLEGRWIEKNRPRTGEGIRILYKEKFTGCLFVLHIAFSDTLLIKYFGEEKLSLQTQYITPAIPYLLPHGTMLKGQNSDAVYYNDLHEQFIQNAGQERIVFQGRNLTLANQIHPFSFAENSGQVIGILGSTESNTDVLLKILGGKKRPSEGILELNGVHVFAEKHKLNGLIVYLPSDGQFIEDDTVYETLKFHARICFSDFSNDGIIRTLANCIKRFGLDEVQFEKICKLTSLEKRKLLLAVALMHEPVIVLLEDPFKGLNETESDVIFNLLRLESASNKLMIASIGDESRIRRDLFDKLWLFDTDGYIVYQGKSYELEKYIEEVTAQTLASSNCKQCGNLGGSQITRALHAKKSLENKQGRRKFSPLFFYEKYNEKIGKKIRLSEGRHMLPRLNFSLAPYDMQLYLLAVRDVRRWSFKPRHFFFLLFLYPLAASILVFLTRNSPESHYTLYSNPDLPVFFFLTTLLAFALPMFIFRNEFVSDEKNLKLSFLLGLSRFNFINAKLIFLFFLLALQSLLFVITACYPLGLGPMAFETGLLFFSLSCSGLLLGLMFTTGKAKRISSAGILGLILGLQILFCGYLIPFRNNPNLRTASRQIPWLAELMPLRWAGEALMVTQFKNNPYNQIFYETDRKKTDAEFKANMLIPTAKASLDSLLKANLNTNNFRANLNFLSHTIATLADTAETFNFEYAPDLSKGLFNQQISQATSEYLIYQKIYYTSKIELLRQEKDSLSKILTDSLGLNAVKKLQEKYTNFAVANLVQRLNEPNFLVATQSGLMQNQYPVYQFPMNNTLRTHFYSPVKRINNQFIDCFWFNLSIIWAMNAVLYVLLLFNVPVKLLRWFTKVIAH
jgi:ABC transport system ATP-binding/permease protein